MKLIVTIIIVLATSPSFGRELQVDGTGVVSVTGDIADMQFEVEARGPIKDVIRVKNQAEIKVKNFFAALAEQGITDVSGSQIEIRIDQDRDRNTGRVISESWEVQRPLFVELQDIDKLDKVIRIALEHDIKGPRRIRYHSSRYDDAVLKSRELAIADSLSKADYMVQQYGVCLGAIQTIGGGRSPNVERGDRNRRGAVLMAQAAGGRQGPTIYVPGAYDPEALTIASSVSVTFEIEEC
jgi:uncharacterized protein YggE